jgi:hypothetical protein
MSVSHLRFVVYFPRVTGYNSDEGKHCHDPSTGKDKEKVIGGCMKTNSKAPATQCLWWYLENSRGILSRYSEPSDLPTDWPTPLGLRRILVSGVCVPLNNVVERNKKIPFPLEHSVMFNSLPWTMENVACYCHREMYSVQESVLMVPSTFFVVEGWAAHGHCSCWECQFHRNLPTCVHKDKPKLQPLFCKEPHLISTRSLAVWLEIIFLDFLKANVMIRVA